MRVAAFTKYGDRAASTRQRVLQYIPLLERHGIDVRYHALLSNSYVDSLVSGARVPRMSIVRSYGRRLIHLLHGVDADMIWVYAELFPYLPGAFERLALRSGKPIIYDFDDAFFEQYPADGSPLRKVLHGKLDALMQRAAICSCGNAYLRDYAVARGANAVIIPTVVDTSVYRPRTGSGSGGPVVGWIGSPSTWAYLSPILPLVAEQARAAGGRVLVIGAGRGAAANAIDGVEFVDWEEEKEVELLQSMDIGIMPLPDEPWSRGKSGYKLIQYMACGLPVIASPVGVNAEIVEAGRTGFLAIGTAEWKAALSSLLGDLGLRRAMGAAGRQRAIEHYSLAVYAPKMVELFSSLKGPTRA